MVGTLYVSNAKPCRNNRGRNRARRIKTDHFSERFENARIILTSGDTAVGKDKLSGAALIAVDQDDLVIGATRSARNIYGLSNADLQNLRPLASLHGQEVDQARAYAYAEQRIIQQAMASTSGNVSARRDPWRSLVRRSIGN